MSDSMAVERLRKLAAIDDYPLRVVGADDLRTLLTEHDALLRRAEEAEAKNEELRKALKSIEFTSNEGSVFWCRACRQVREFGHADNCIVGKALSLTPPEALEQKRELRREVAEECAMIAGEHGTIGAAYIRQRFGLDQPAQPFDKRQKAHPTEIAYEDLPEHVREAIERNMRVGSAEPAQQEGSDA